MNAQVTLASIAEQRPDLIDEPMLKAIEDTAAGRVHFDRDKSEYAPFAGERGLSVTYRFSNVTHSGKLIGDQDNDSDNEARATAQQTLKTIAEKRPDLIAANTTGNSLQNSSFSGNGANLPRTLVPPEASRSAEASKPASVIPKQSAPSLHVAPAPPRPASP